MSLDPLMMKYPQMSPYCAFNNNPVFFVDPDGLEGEKPGKIKMAYLKLTNKNLRQAFRHQKRNGGDINVWKGKNGKWFASVVYSSSSGKYKKSGEIISFDNVNVNATVFAPENTISGLGLAVNGFKTLYNWFSSKDWTIDVGGKITIGAQLKVSSGLKGLASGEAGINFLSAELVSGHVDLTELGSNNPDAYSGRYIYEDQKIHFEQSIKAEIEVLRKAKFGPYWEHKFYTMGSSLENTYGHTYDYGVNVGIPIYKNKSSKEIIEHISKTGNANMGDIKVKAVLSKKFVGLDLSAEAAIVLGIKVKLKIGYYE